MILESTAACPSPADHEVTGLDAFACEHAVLEDGSAALVVSRRGPGAAELLVACVAGGSFSLTWMPAARVRLLEHTRW